MRASAFIRSTSITSNKFTLRRLLTICAWALTLSLFIAPCTHAEGGTTIASAKTDYLNISLTSQGKESFLLGISSNAGQALQPIPFTLDNPTRLVVDITGVASSRSQTIPLNNGLLGALRVGSHKEKTRIVVDIKGSLIPSVNVNGTNSTNLGVQFTFLEQNDSTTDTPSTDSSAKATKSDSLDQELAQALKMKKEEVIPPSPRPIITGSTPSTPIIIDTPKPEAPSPSTTLDDELAALDRSEAATPEPIKEPETTPELSKESAAKVVVEKSIKVENNEPMIPAPEAVAPKSTISEPTEEPSSDGSALVQGIFFKTTESGGKFAVMVKVPNLGESSLVKKKANIYELTLEHAKLNGKYLSLPQFPPDNFLGLEGVVAVERGDAVIVKIFVSEDAKLSQFRSGSDELWVQATK